MVVNIALAVAVGSRLFPRVSSLDWTILAASGTIGALFGTPVAAALIFRKPSTAATSRRCGIAFCAATLPPPRALTTGLFFHPHFTLPIPIMARCASSISSAV